MHQSRFQNYFRDDGKGEIECRYASKEDVDKEPMSKSPYKGPSNEEHINSVLAAGDTSDIVNDDKKASNTVSRNASIGNETVGNITKHAKDNGTARVEKTNNTVLNRNDTSQNVSSRFHRTKLNSTSDAQDSTAFNGVLWMFSKLLDGWLYGYNSVWRLLKAGNCPMPWLTSTRLHCNAGKLIKVLRLKDLKMPDFCTVCCWGWIGRLSSNPGIDQWTSTYGKLSSVLQT